MKIPPNEFIRLAFYVCLSKKDPPKSGFGVNALNK